MSTENYFANIERLARERGYSITSLSTAAGLDRSTVGKWKAGLGKPTLSSAKKIAELLGCTIDEIAGVNGSGTDED